MHVFTPTTTASTTTDVADAPGADNFTRLGLHTNNPQTTEVRTLIHTAGSMTADISLITPATAPNDNDILSAMSSGQESWVAP